MHYALHIQLMHAYLVNLPMIIIPYTYRRLITRSPFTRNCDSHHINASVSELAQTEKGLLPLYIYGSVPV
jgi:hypothetical protein